MDSISQPLRSSSEMLAPSPTSMQTDSPPSTEVSQHQNTGATSSDKSLLNWDISASPVNMTVHLTDPDKGHMKELFGKINERLGVMKDVAAWKSLNDKPTEDLEQEKRVLDAAHKMAIEHKIIPEMWEAFIQAQMDAAKEIQNHLRKQWEENREAKPADFRTIEESRDDIATISKEILSMTVHCLSSHQVIQDARSLFMNSITTENLSETTKQNLFQKLAAVQLAPDMAMGSHAVVP